MPPSSTHDVTSSRPRRHYKVLLLGDSGVGKSSLVARLIENVDDANVVAPLEPRRATIGVDFARRAFTVAGADVVLVLWDTSGQERFNAVAPTMYRGVDALVLVYDISNERSFEALTRRWLPAFTAHASARPVVTMLLGNKSDAPAAVDAEEARALAATHGFLVARASAATAECVTYAFATLAAALVRAAPVADDDTPGRVVLGAAADGDEHHHASTACCSS